MATRTFGKCTFEPISIPSTEEDREADVGRSRAAPALAPPSDVAADVDEDQELKAWISDINSAVRQPLIKAAGCEIPMGQLVEGGESFEPPVAKDVLFMPVRLRKQLAVLERLRRQAADYIKRTEPLKKGARDGCPPLSMMAARDLKTPLGARKRGESRRRPIQTHVRSKINFRCSQLTATPASNRTHMGRAVTLLGNCLNLTSKGICVMGSALYWDAHLTARSANIRIWENLPRIRSSSSSTPE